MSDLEVQAFLGSNRKAQIATLLPDGIPHLTTVFYALMDGEITFWTYRSSQKAVNLRRTATIAALVEDGERYEELRGVSIVGEAELIDSVPEVKRIGLGIVGDTERGRDVVSSQSAKRTGVVIAPHRVVSWDHRKL